MNGISRVRLPKSPETADLYLRASENVTVYQGSPAPTIVLAQGEWLSSNTYFNSLYESFYDRYTHLRQLAYQFRLEGSFCLTFYRERESGDRQQIQQQRLENCQATDPVTIALTAFLQTEQPGRIYFELTSLQNDSRFLEAWLATEQPRSRDVHLGVISCTYKKEPYIQNTVRAIQTDALLQQKKLDVFVVDNGQTLDHASFNYDDRVRLIANRNYGGSGGFARGLLEAIQEGNCSHFLFMDDDVELDSEAVCKLISLYEYAKSEFAIAGGMLDLHKKTLLFEAGAHYGRCLFRPGFEPFEIAPLKTDTDLSQPESLNGLLAEEAADYGAFWFFAFSRQMVEEIGLPLPFFIKGDDIEFGLRISRILKNRIVAFPGIAVWHEPFYAKFPVWDTYYYFRNILITHAVHESLSYFSVIKAFTARLIYTLLFFDYNSAGMLLRAFEDYLRGPDFLKARDPEQLHAEMLKLSKSYQNQQVDYDFSPPATKPHVPNAGLLRKVLSFLTLNGHLLPSFLIHDQAAFIWYAPGFPGQRSRALAKKRVAIFKEKAACLYTYEIDQQAGIQILLHWFRLVFDGYSRWSGIGQAWRKTAPEFVSIEFWQKYLGLNSSVERVG